MALNLNSKKGLISDINVTPLVDVMLVLLVIFMVTAPMMFSGVNLKLPKTSKINSLNLKAEFVILSVSAAEEYFLGKDLLSRKTLIPKVLHMLKKNKTDVVYLRADYSLKYEKVAQLIALLKKNGISQIALVTEIEKK